MPNAMQTPAAGLKVPLSPERLKFWQKQTENARRLREEHIEQWDVAGNLERYAPKNAKTLAGKVNTGVDFRDVERKKASLFYDRPTVSVLPDAEGDPQAAVLHQEILNTQLHRMNAKATALKAILNCLVAIQPAPTKLGYIPTEVEVDQPRLMPALDPATGEPVQVPALDDKRQPIVDKVPVIVHEEWFWSMVSPKAVLLPRDFRDTDYDKAPWIGYEWRKPLSQVRREFGLPKDWTPEGRGDGAREVTFTDADNKPEASDHEEHDPPVNGVYLEYQAHLFDEKVRHPELRRRLVLVEGHDKAVQHDNVPWQDIDPQSLNLTPDSMFGFSVHPLATRDLPDSAYVPSDSTITGPLTREGNRYLEQVLTKRDSNRLVLLTDVDKIDVEAIEKVKQMPALKDLGFAVVPVQAGALQQGVDAVMRQVPTLDLGRETYEGMDRTERHREGILGISSNQGGVVTETKRTATENAIIQRNSEARFEQERQRVLEWWLKGVEKLSALIVRYGDRLAVEILGPEKAQAWVAAKQAGKLGRFTFELAIDSGRFIDIEAKRRQTLQVINFAAKSPFVNQAFMWAELAKDMGYDPSKFLVQPEPPKPEPPKMALSAKAENFVGPEGAILLDLLKQLGYPINPEAVQNALAMAKAMQVEQLNAEAAEAGGPGAGLGPPEQGGAADKAPRIDQHMDDESGALPGQAAGLL